MSARDTPGRKKLRKGGGITNLHVSKSTGSLPSLSSASSSSASPAGSASSSSGRDTPATEEQSNKQPSIKSKAQNRAELETLELPDDPSSGKLGEVHMRRLKLVNESLKNYTYTHFSSLTSMFKKIDKDKSGKVTVEEFWEALKSHKLNDAITYENAKELFTLVDRDGSGEIEFPEFVCLFNDPYNAIRSADEARKVIAKDGTLKPSTRQLIVEKAKVESVKLKILDRITKDQEGAKVVQNNTSHINKMFKRFDINNDGILTYKELRTTLGERYLNIDLSIEEFRTLCSCLDKDGNGYVNNNEFIRSLRIPGIDKDYNPFHQGRVKQLTALKHILAKPIEWIDPTKDPPYTFDRVTAADVRATPDFMHPAAPSVSRPITAPSLNNTVAPTEDLTAIRNKTSDTWFLKEWETGSPRQHLSEVRNQRAIPRSLSEATFGARVTEDPDKSCKKSIFADIESPLKQLRENVTQSIVFTALDEAVKQGQVSKYQSTPVLVNTSERLSMDAGGGARDRFTTTMDLCYPPPGGLNEISPWGIKSIQNAETRATKINKLRQHLNRLEAVRVKNAQVEKQFDERRVRTRSRIRHSYYQNLQNKEEHIKPICKVMDFSARNRYFGTSPESILFRPVVYAERDGEGA